MGELYVKAYKYRTINSYRNAIYAFHGEIEGNKIGKHDPICQFMAGISTKTTKAKIHTNVDVNKVLSYIIDMEKNKDLSLK